MVPRPPARWGLDALSAATGDRWRLDRRVGLCPGESAAWYTASVAAVAAARAEALPCALPRRRPEPVTQARVAEQPLERGAKRRDVARRNEQARDLVLDGVEKAADRGGDDRAAVRHRLARDDAVALAPRGADDDRSPLVGRAELRGRDEPARPGTRSRSGPSPTTTSGSPAWPRPARGRPSPRRAGRRRARAAARRAAPTRPGRRPLRVPSRRSRAPRPCARPANASEATTTARARRTSRRASGRAACDSTSVPHSWSTKGRRAASAGTAEGSQCAWTRSASRAARRAARAYEAGRAAERHEPRPPAEVGGDPVAVGDAVVAERGRRHHVDDHSRRPQRLDRVADEGAGDVARGPRDTTWSAPRRARRVPQYAPHEPPPPRMDALGGIHPATPGGGDRRTGSLRVPTSFQ